MDEWMNVYQIFFCQVAVFGINVAESSSSDTMIPQCYHCDRLPERHVYCTGVFVVDAGR
jgi:hypothetical protein